MKTTIVVLLAFLAAVLLVWCYVYREYDTMSEEVVTKYRVGDFAGMELCITTYENRLVSYLFRSTRYIRKFSTRIAYAKGVAGAGLGSSPKSEPRFLEAAASAEVSIAVSALYNGAEYLIARGELDAARERYRKALTLDPYDMQTKINLELLLKKIQQRNASEDAEKDKLKSEAGESAGDYWLRRIAEKEGQSSSSSRIYK